MLQMQKVIKVGNSLAVTLDKQFVSSARIKSGQQMAVMYKPEMGLVSMAKAKSDLAAGHLMVQEKQAYMAGKITPELEQWTDKFLLENQEAMKKLADL